MPHSAPASKATGNRRNSHGAGAVSPSTSRIQSRCAIAAAANPGSSDARSAHGAHVLPGGVDRAFAKLDSIKEHVWWEAGAQPPQMLADGEVAMSTAYNWRIFNAQVVEKQPFGDRVGRPASRPWPVRHSRRRTEP